MVFGFLLSGRMTLLVSGISTVRAFEIGDNFITDWAAAFVSAWPVAFPSVLLVAPLVRRLVRSLVITNGKPG